VTYTSALVGFFLGFGFGVGCALAVMYSIYMGGYRTAVDESVMAVPPPRLVKARAKALQRLGEGKP
jgi:hypothetical protein